MGRRRSARIRTCRVGLVDPGSVSLGFLGADGLPLPLDLAYANTHRDARHRFEQCAELGLATRCGRKVASIAETHRLLGIPVPS